MSCTPWLLTVPLVALAACSQVIGYDDLSTGSPPPDGSGGGSSTSTGSSSGCISNGQCTVDNGQLPYRCEPESGMCVSLLSPECTEIIGPLDHLQDDDEDLLVLGLIAPQGEGRLDEAEQLSNGIRLASEEFAAFGGEQAPNVMVVRCDEAVAVDAARHLVDEVRAAAILGPFEDAQATATILTQIARPSGTTMLLPTAQSEAVTLVDDGGVRWQLRPDAATEARALGRFLPEYITDGQKPHRQEPAATPTDVAVVVQASSRYAAMQGSFEAAATWNVGLPGIEEGTVAENTTALHYQPVSVEPAGASAALAGLTATQPDVVVVLGDAPELLAGIEALELQWPAAVARPWYLVGHDLRGPALEAVLGNATGAVPALADRVYGFGPPPPDGDTWSAFLANYGARFDGEDGGAFWGPTGYDATYLVGLAAFAAGGAPVTNDALSDGLLQLLGPGPQVQARGIDILTALTALAGGSTIDFEGILSSYDFDPTTKKVTEGVAQWCADATGSWVTSGYTFDPQANAFSGDPSACPYVGPQ